MRFSVLAISMGLCPFVAAGQGADLNREEQAIRRIVERVVQGGEMPYADDAIFVSGVYDRALIGKEALQAARSQVERDPLQKRSNERVKYEVVRVDVAKSGDMAYEFDHFTMAFENAARNAVEFKGEILRVWKKAGGEWKVAASFARPNPEPRREK